MNISAPFVHRPVATTLLTVAIALAGAVAFRILPVSPLPQVDFPTISVSASLPGASPETMASSVATPLERQFGRIAAVTEMTSSSTLGSCSITLQFDLNRNIDSAARDVQAAIAAARGYLPTNLPNNPTYRKVNPADSPIFMIALTSNTLSKGQMYDAASTIMAQKLAQVQGVGQVGVGGSALPGVRVELNPPALNKYGIGLEQVRQVLGAANANTPKGHLSDGKQMWEVGANDQLFNAVDYKPLLVAYHNGMAVRISDIGSVVDATEDLRNAGYANGKPSVLVIIFRQPGANIIETVDRIRAVLPQIHAAIPASIDMRIAMDQTQTIRASVSDVERTLVLSVGLVVLVVFVFLKNVRSTFIPSIAVPVSLLGTFGVMYLFGYSLDNLSLMALTISTGFVVDDAIVVIENVTRYLEAGLNPFAAALKGAQEIGSTVITMSISLVAVFIPLLLMGGIVGRLLREFAVTLSVAIGVSMVVSLTATPMMCAHLLKGHETHGRLYETTERAFDWVVNLYGKTLSVVLRHAFLTLLVLLTTVGLNVYLFMRVPKGFFPQQDTGRMGGQILADQDTSFQSMDKTLLEMVNIVAADPAVDTVNGFTGGGGGGGGGASTLNQGRMFVSLKPLNERKITVDFILQRLRPKLAKVPGATLYLQPAQDLRVGGRNSAALYQFTMRGDNLQDLITYAPKMFQELKSIPQIVDVNSDQQNRGLQSLVTYDRETAARFGISPQLIDNTLYDAFGQRQVSTMYKSLNQYHVVMEAAPQYLQNPQGLRDIYIHAPNGQQIRLDAIAHYGPAVAPLSVNHQGLFPSVTISFNLQPGVALGDAVVTIEEASRKVGLPNTIQTMFTGTAQAYQDSLGSEPYLIAAALAAVYLMLGILYESTIHPITILSTLPSAGVGALLALILTHTDLSIIAMIGVILLIGLVKKNGILIVDFAMAAERNEGKSPRDAIFEASLLRFRPILMTTFAAMLGALPLALGTGTGSELRRPLGITIIGGLLMSQALTLFTTPVVYLYFDRLQHWWERVRGVEGRPMEEAGAGSMREKRSVAQTIVSAGSRLVSTWFAGKMRPLLRLPASNDQTSFGKGRRNRLPHRRSRNSSATRWLLVAVMAAVALLSPGCLKVPPYQRPSAVTPSSFKEAPPAGWKESQPSDGALRGNWWEIFGDPALNALEEQVSISNQNVLQAEAQFRQAKAAVRVARAALFPSVTTSPTVTASQASSRLSTRAGPSSVQGIYNLPVSASYTADVWGGIHRAVTASANTAQSAAAVLENAKLLYQSELAQDYFQMHGLDADRALLQQAVQSYQEFLTLTKNRFAGGVASDSDVAQAETQLYTTQAQLTDIESQRQQLEHAMAVLTGKPPAELTIPTTPIQVTPPEIPVGLPSALLERRPDVAESERQAAAANQQIGIAKAAFYPTLTIAATAGLQSSSFLNWITWPSRFWTLGPQLAQVLFDAGKRTAQLEQAEANYDSVAAGYRQTVLTAFQQVEDNLAALRVLGNEASVLDQAVKSAERSLTVSTAQYKAGTVSYLQVITAQTIALADERSALDIQTRRMVASVLLIEALGGGWDASKLPTVRDVGMK